MQLSQWIVGRDTRATSGSMFLNDAMTVVCKDVSNPAYISHGREFRHKSFSDKIKRNEPFKTEFSQRYLCFILKRCHRFNKLLFYFSYLAINRDALVSRNILTDSSICVLMSKIQNDQNITSKYNKFAKIDGNQDLGWFSHKHNVLKNKNSQ